MNTIKRKLMATLVLAALGAPVAVQADTAPMPVAAEPTATLAERMERRQTMRARMHEILQNTDPVKRRALLEAQLDDMEAMARMGPPEGMGMRMGAPGGMGMMMKPYDKSDCRMARDADDRRLEALEKRVDMMQTILGMMVGR